MCSLCECVVIFPAGSGDRWSGLCRCGMRATERGGQGLFCFVLFIEMKADKTRRIRVRAVGLQSKHTQVAVYHCFLLLHRPNWTTLTFCLITKKNNERKTVRYSILFCSLVLFINVCVSVRRVSPLLILGFSAALSRAGRSLEYCQKCPLSDLAASAPLQSGHESKLSRRLLSHY